MGITESLLIIGGLITLAVPVLCQLRIEEGKRKGSRTLWWYLFILAAVGTACGAVFEIGQRQEELLQQMEHTNRIIKTVRAEALRLQPSDFQIRMISTADADLSAYLDTSGDVHCEGQIDTAHVIFELVPVGALRKSRAGRGGGGRPGLRRVAANVMFIGMEGIKYLGDLDGKQLHLEIPIREIEVVPGKWQHIVDVSVKGRHFGGELDANGEITIAMILPQEDRN